MRSARPFVPCGARKGRRSVITQLSRRGWPVKRPSEIFFIACLLVAPYPSAGAQRVTATGVTRADLRASATPVGYSIPDSTASARPVRMQEATTGSRGRNAVTGALAGAALGGVAGFVADSRDHSGEGLIAPVMVGLGAI